MQLNFCMRLKLEDCDRGNTFKLSLCTERLCPLPSTHAEILTPNAMDLWFSSVQFSSVTQSCLTLCNPMNHSTPGLPVHHQLLEFTQTHVHRVSDAIQPSHPMSSPFPPASNPSEHQRLPMSQQTSDESTLHMRWPKYGSFSLAACFSS